MRLRADDVTVGDRPDHGGERGGKHVETDDLAPLGAQDADDCLTEVTGRAGHEDPPLLHATDDSPSPAGHVEAAIARRVRRPAPEIVRTHGRAREGRSSINGGAGTDVCIGWPGIDMFTYLRDADPVAVRQRRSQVKPVPSEPVA